MRLTKQQRIEAYKYARNNKLKHYFLIWGEVKLVGICERLMKYLLVKITKDDTYSSTMVHDSFPELMLFEKPDSFGYWFTNEHTRQIVLDFCIEMAKDAKE